MVAAWVWVGGVGGWWISVMGGFSSWVGFSHGYVLVVGWWILVLGLLPWVMGLLIGVVEWWGGDQRGGFQYWWDRWWWVSRSARSAVVSFWVSGFQYCVFFLIIFFFSWWLWRSTWLVMVWWRSTWVVMVWWWWLVGGWERETEIRERRD